MNNPQTNIPNQFQNFGEQASQGSSIYNGITGGELTRQLPPLPTKSYEK